MSHPHHTWVVVPIKSFGQAKQRLKPALEDDERSRLARLMAERVIHAAQPWPVAVVCNDTHVADFARTHGARVIEDLGLGLNAAVATAVTTLREEGVSWVVVAHADIPLVGSIPDLFRSVTPGLVAFNPDLVALVPDRHHDGTNLMLLPTASGFEFAYGAGSFRKHRLEALRNGFAFTVIEDARFALDIDTPADFERWLAIDPDSP